MRDFNPGMQSVAMQPVLDAPLVFFMHRLPLLYGPKQSLLSRNNHSFLGPEVFGEKLSNCCSNRSGMEIAITTLTGREGDICDGLFL